VKRVLVLALLQALVLAIPAVAGGYLIYQYDTIGKGYNLIEGDTHAQLGDFRIGVNARTGFYFDGPLTNTRTEVYIGQRWGQTRATLGYYRYFYPGGAPPRDGLRFTVKQEW
jgi:hypothetical protein